MFGMFILNCAVMHCEIVCAELHTIFLDRTAFLLGEISVVLYK